MRKLTLKTVILPLAVAIAFGISCSRVSEKPGGTKNFTVRITDKPLTFTNPLNINVGSERARRGGEPVVVLYKDDYYLFVTGGGGYWCSPNLRDWTYIQAPNFPRGVPSAVTDGETMYACGMNAKGVFASTDPKSGKWEQVGTLDSDRYGDANIFIDDDGRFYMYWGWSQILPFQAVELDPKTFKEIGEPKILIFGNYKEHGFETRRAEDVIFPYFTHRPYFPEEYPWIEGPWMTKYDGKYYLQYAAIGLEFLSYSHGVYVSDSPLGPFEYSQHNPLTFKTTGYLPGAGHGSTFKDKNGQFWTICMIPAWYGGRGGGEIVLFPTAIDAEGVMHSNTAFGDYPQYYPGIKENAVENNFTGWMLLSNKKYVEVSSTLEGFDSKNAVDENFMTKWVAKSGDQGEYMTIDLGKECDIRALQINFDRHDAAVGVGRGFAPTPPLDRYQCYTVEISNDNANWSMLIDKSNNAFDNRHDYTELAEPANARYVKITNVFTHDSGKFSLQEFRIFGNPTKAKFTKVTSVLVARNPEDRRDATITWQPVEGADGYIVRYGIEPGKLYNNYMVYDNYTLTIHSLNTKPEYYFEVEAFESGTDYYREVTEQTMGLGAEIELMKGPQMIERKMVKQGVSEYVFDSITPGEYTFRHTFGPVLWRGELTQQQLSGSADNITVTDTLAKLGKGTEVLGQIEMKVVPGGKEGGKFVVIMNYNK
ncbi:MAG TPA: family 43 glycosylhydrolase [Bacteroidales bacterium]|nr:family 43 glycosylhydrolase [Bacteroidales bacterium]